MIMIIFDYIKSVADMPHIEVKHLELIQSIAETENLTRAARRLNISQPALSRRLMDIEDRLGTRLFLRSKKRMILTPEGSRMLKSASTILSELEKAELDISKIVNGETGTLRIGVSCLFCFQWLPVVVADFQQQYPKVNLAISACNDFDEDFKANLFDVVVTAVPVNDNGYDGVNLFTDELVIILSPDHPLSGRRYIGPKDVSREKIIINMNLSIEHFSQMLWPDTPITPQAVMRIGHPNAIIELVKAGLGISLAPRWAVRSYLDEGSLVAVPLSERGIHPTWKAVYPKNRSLPAFQKKFIDLLMKHKLPQCSEIG